MTRDWIERAAERIVQQLAHSSRDMEKKKHHLYVMIFDVYQAFRRSPELYHDPYDQKRDNTSEASPRASCERNDSQAGRKEGR